MWLSPSCQAKNPKADRAKAMMPTSSSRQLKGGKGMWDIGPESQQGFVIWIATTYTQTRRLKTKMVKANER